ncbi:glutaminase [Microbacterium sp.]|uniref:glutaminase n=1 Tax=Microbacterium sp. TaxID=51671 RepID=UPI003A8E65F1
MEIAELMDAARRRLGDAPHERLGLLVQPRRILGVARAPRIVPHGSVWHLGVLLLGDGATADDSGVFATGRIVRAHEEVRRGFTAESQRERAALEAAARRGGFAEGKVVHLDWQPIDLKALARGEASGPLAIIAGTPSIRWSRTAGYGPLEPYLDEHIELLRHPPAGAT